MKTAELKKLMDDELTNRPMKEIKVHLKTESLTKFDDIITSFQQQKARTIMWQRYAVAALFSGVFMEAKRRLKELLSDTFKYADGMTP